MGNHIVKGQFQSDKYPTCPPGKVPLSVNDKAAQPLLWIYAQGHRAIDPEFSADLEAALKAAGYTPGVMGGDEHLMLQGAEEIRHLRRTNEILSAKVDLFAQVLNTQPATRGVGMTEDIAWKLEKRAAGLVAPGANQG